MHQANLIKLITLIDLSILKVAWMSQSKPETMSLSSGFKCKT